MAGNHGRHAVRPRHSRPSTARPGTERIGLDQIGDFLPRQRMRIVPLILVSDGRGRDGRLEIVGMLGRAGMIELADTFRPMGMNRVGPGAVRWDQTIIISPGPLLSADANGNGCPGRPHAPGTARPGPERELHQPERPKIEAHQPDAAPRAFFEITQIAGLRQAWTMCCEHDPVGNGQRAECGSAAANSGKGSTARSVIPLLATASSLPLGSRNWKRPATGETAKIGRGRSCRRPGSPRRKRRLEVLDIDHRQRRRLGYISVSGRPAGRDRHRRSCVAGIGRARIRSGARPEGVCYRTGDWTPR